MTHAVSCRSRLPKLLEGSGEKMLARSRAKAEVPARTGLRGNMLKPVVEKSGAGKPWRNSHDVPTWVQGKGDKKRVTRSERERGRERERE